MKGRITRILLALTMVVGAFAVGGCATKSQSGNQVENPKNKKNKPDRKQDKQSDSAEDPPPPPPPPTY